MGGNKLITGIVIIFLIAAFGFSLYYFTTGDDTASTLEVSGPNATDTAATIASRDFLIVLGKFESIKFSTSTLDDRVFISLIDQSVSLPLEPMGRQNPFAPLGAEGSTTSATQR